MKFVRTYNDDTEAEGYILAQDIKSLEILYPLSGAGCWLLASVDGLEEPIKIGNFMDASQAHHWVRETLDPPAEAPEGKKHITLSFNLFDTDDMEEYKGMMRHRDYYCCLWDIKQEMRKIWKYEDGLSDGEQKMIDRVYEFVCQTIGEYPFGEEF